MPQQQQGFDPNTLAEPSRPEWSTYIAGRRPKFKLHKNRGQALQAVSYASRQCQVYRWDFGEDRWIEVFSGAVPVRWGKSNRELCDRCGKSTTKRTPYERRSSNGWEEGVRVHNAGKWGWLAEPNNKKKLVEPFKQAWLCTSCR